MYIHYSEHLKCTVDSLILMGTIINSNRSTDTLIWMQRMTEAFGDVLLALPSFLTSLISSGCFLLLQKRCPVSCFDQSRSAVDAHVPVNHLLDLIPSPSLRSLLNACLGASRERREVSV